MITRQIDCAQLVQQVYDGHGGDPTFADVLARAEVEDDGQIADLIESDGRLRMRLGRTVGLERYLGAIADLGDRQDALDAAIDMTLRAAARTGRADDATIDRLVAAHPDLEAEIRDSASLGNALWSTGGFQKQLETWPDKRLPCPFGPKLESGERRYELRQLLGEGAFGQVYLAVDGQLSEKGHAALVSIKVLPGQHRTLRSRQRMLEEATKARRIDHPNVVRVLDRGLSEQSEDFIVYEYVGGGDLARWVRRLEGHGGRLEVRDAARLAAAISRGVHAAHMAGLVHCDLKPSNIVLDSDDEPKVADFGIAIRTGEEVPDRDDTSASDAALPEPLGNLAFMSPEQYRMEPGALTIPSDVYALGGMLYWMLSGRLPNGVTPQEIREHHANVTDDPRLPRPYAPDLDGDLVAIAERAMAPDPKARYASADAFANDLEAWLAHQPIAWRHPSSLRRLRLWTLRKPALAAASAALVILGAGSAVAIAFWSGLAEARREANEKAWQVLEEHTVQVEAMNADGLFDEVLMQSWLMEWLFGPTVLGDGGQRAEVWKIRDQTVEAIVEARRSAGYAGDLETLSWETAYGFWILKAGRASEAAEFLRGTNVRWRSLLARPDDPWLVHMDGLLACAESAEIASDPGAPPPAPEKLHRLRLALEASARLHESFCPGDPLHVVELEALMTLCGDRFLADPTALAEHEARHGEFSE